MFKVTNDKTLIALTREELEKIKDTAYKKGYDDAKNEPKKTVTKAKSKVKDGDRTVELRNAIVEEEKDE